MRHEIVVIGVSAGGLDALCTILRGLPERIDFAMVIVQHRSRDSYALCDVLQHCSKRSVHEVVDKDEIERGEIYLAPADYHLLIEPGMFALSLDAPEFYSRPSIDTAFETAADAYGPRALGVVLTGANRDGARGLRRIVDRGGAGVVQDPATAEVPVMPATAILEVPEAEIVPLTEVAARICALVDTAPPQGGR